MNLATLLCLQSSNLKELFRNFLFTIDYRDILKNASPLKTIGLYLYMLFISYHIQ